MNRIQHKLLTALTDAADRNEGRIKIRSGSYMPLVVENIGEITVFATDWPAYSLCHYYTQNGDMMRDPEMCFARVKAEGEDYFVPYYFRQDGGLPIEQMAIRGKGYLKRMQHDHAVFARKWLSNLRNQGFEEKLEWLAELEELCPA